MAIRVENHHRSPLRPLGDDHIQLRHLVDDGVEVASVDVERHVIHLLTTVDVSVALEQIEALMATAEEDHPRIGCPGSRSSFFETEHLHVEALRTLRVGDVQHHVIDPTYLQIGSHRRPLPLPVAYGPDARRSANTATSPETTNR